MKTDNTITLDEIKLPNEKKLVCREPLVLTIEEEGDLLVVKNPKLGIHCYEYTEEKLLNEIREDLQILWEEYALGRIDKLSPRAIELKEQLLLFFTEKD
jgi:hypothetical protein